MKFFLTVALSLFAGHAVFAQDSTNTTAVSDVFIISPVASTIWTTGDSVEIDWSGGNGTLVPVYLDMGPGTAQVIVATIATSVDSSSGSVTWTVPSNLTAGNDYSIQIGDSPYWSFSHLFIIIAPGGNASTFTTAPTSSSAAPSSSMVTSTAVMTTTSHANATGSNSTATSTSTAKSGAAKNIATGCVLAIVPALMALML